MNPGRMTGFFTVGVSPEDYVLPHPRLGLPVILLVRRVLLKAFELLREESFPFATAQEDQVTTALRGVIESNLRQRGSVKGFSKRTYEKVVRGGQWSNHDGTVLIKTPDLCFESRNDEEPPPPIISEFNGLFVECKPVDDNHPVGGKYCDDGLNRFVEGSYAWAMQEGMMLAYSRHGCTIETHLLPAMRKEKRAAALGVVDFPTMLATAEAAAADGAEAVYVSRHRRDFPWRDHKGPATDIWVYHLWHCCD